MPEAPFLGRTINETVKKFEGLESLNTRYKLGEDQKEFSE